MMVGVGVITVFHHLIADAWSLSLFISEITDIYSKLLSINNSSFETFTPYPSYSTNFSIKRFTSSFLSSLSSSSLRNTDSMG